MKLLRFMSQSEFDKYLAGDDLLNDTVHAALTDSVGFCFLDADWYSPDSAYEFMSGIVSNEVAAIFETDIPLTESYGWYADPDGCWGDSMQVTEYCVNRYDSLTFRLISKYSLKDYFTWMEEVPV